MVRLPEIVIVSCVSVLLSLVIAGCEGNPDFPFYPDRDAIVDMINTDLVEVFNTQVIDLTVPDTLILSTAYWREIDSVARRVSVSFSYEGTPHEVPLANVSVLDSMFGCFHLLIRDTTKSPPLRARVKKPLTELATVHAQFEKWGEDNDPWKGWILTAVSGVEVHPRSSARSLTSVTLQSSSVGELTLTEREIRNAGATNELPELSDRESVNLNADVGNSTDVVFMHYNTSSGFTKSEMYPVGERTFRGSFRAPQNRGYYHLTVDLISLSTITDPDTSLYDSKRWGILYKVD
jgi:hypothetical protein